MNQNTIKLEGNGNIVIQDAQSGNITINISDPNLFETIQLLNKEQITVLQQMVDEKSDRFENMFRALISEIATQKNVVHGNISNVQSVKIGDEVHYHYHYEIPQTKLPKQLTDYIPLLSQGKIIGREKDLQDVYNRLFDNRQVVVVNGLDGIGKTTLAQVYTTKYWVTYKHIVWISQLSENIINDFVNKQGLIERLNISEGISDPNDIFHSIIRKLSDIEDQPSLLILDNADFSLEKIRSMLPKQPNWHILITSRQEIHGFDLKQLDFLSSEDALT